MFLKKKKKPAWALQMGLDLKRCAECQKYERPCRIGDMPATFHRWVMEEKALFRIDTFLRLGDQERAVQRFREEGIIPPGCGVEKQSACRALVEWPDGSVSLVDPVHVKFLDRERPTK